MYTEVTKWIRDLTKFEQLILGVATASFIIVILFSAFDYLIEFIFYYSPQQVRVRQLQARLEILSPQVQFVETKYREESDTERSLLPLEYRWPIKIKETISLSCEVKQKTEKSSITEPFSVGKDKSIKYERPPETELEKEYCQIKRQLPSRLITYPDLNFGDWIVLIRLGLAMAGLFLGVEILKYTIRAALKR